MSSNSSSQHRPAVKVTMATPTRVRSLIQKASDLEIRLETTKSNEKEKQRLRSQLCETLSDILLTDPEFAMSKDCCGRLWRTCFYSEIGTFRSLIHREKRKKGPALTTYERALKKFLQEAIQLYNFLITNYQERLLPNVLSISQTSLSPSQPEDSQDSQATTGVVTAATSMLTNAGIVEGLHRLLIHLGDLHRYAENFAKAEGCYGKAAKLAPGKGNPYNQLAVVAQLKDPVSPLNCVALYWYARSLLATEEPFTTSYDNLRRLLENNRQTLSKMNKTTTTTTIPTQPDPKTFATAAAGSTALSSKKAMLEANRAQKAAASKLFLIQYVDLHYDFFSGVGASTAALHHNNDHDVHNDNLHSLIVKMERLIESLQSTLQNSAFGDALLCKMVVINVFSVVWSAKPHSEASQQQQQQVPQPPPDHQDDHQQNRKLTTCMAYAFLLAFGAALAERLEQMLGKVLDSPHGPEGIPSVRLLMPLLMSLDFISTLKPQDHPSAFLTTTSHSMSSSFGCLMEFSNKSTNSFWNKVASVANLLTPLQNRVRGGCKAYELQEMKLLQGFVPLLPFTKRDDAVGVDENGYVTAAEAMEALELGGVSAMLSSTQESVASAGSASTTCSPEENKGKVAHFLQMVQHVAKDTTSMYPKLIYDQRGIYHVFPSPGLTDGTESLLSGLIADNNNNNNNHSKFTSRMDSVAVAMNNGLDSTKDDDMDVTDDEQPDDVFVPEADDDDDDRDDNVNMAVEKADGSDVLVYKAPEGGQGPALLVPGALLLTLVNNTKDSAMVPPPPQPPIEMAVQDSAPRNMGPPVAYSNYFQGAAPSTTAETVVPMISERRHPPLSPHHAMVMDVIEDPAPAVPMAKIPVALSPPRPPPGFGGMSSGPVAMPPPTAHSFNQNLFLPMGAAPPSYPGGYGGRTVGDSFPFFGSGFAAQPSAASNPFFVHTPAGIAPAGSTSFPGPFFNGSAGHFLDPEAAASADGSSLLDSSLLSSLWMDETNNNNNHLPPSKQRNPFAAT